VAESEAAWAELYKLQELDEGKDFFGWHGSDVVVFDAAEEPVKSEPTGTSSQRLYVNACKRFKEVPSTAFYKGLSEKEISLPGSSLTPMGIRACAIALLV
jgi:hypothetical protein